MTKTNMAEKRRSAAVVVEEDSKPPKPDTEREFLSQVGVEGPLRGALLKLLEARAEDPIAFLADHFTNLAQASENGAASGGCGAEQQLRARALWHLGLAHHSQRCAFSNNVRLAYELLAQGGGRRRGGLRGQAYSELLRCLCRGGGVSEAAAAPLLRRLGCQAHEAVPFDLFRQGVLTCAVFADHLRAARALHAAVARAGRGPCRAALEALRDALDTADAPDAARYLQAGAKIAPCRLARAMALARAPGEAHPEPLMEPQEFEEEAAALFISRVRAVS
ncbi:tubulin polyglutamylase complex subunit 1 [Lepisosteus oculatus]|uniref:tubulin polyglutamylase complex subunit 1 n=1 Tax=Lepisosteus oculatus TaxID=7918 RepID=UPI0037168D3B